MKSIQQRITVSFLALVSVAALLCGGAGIITNFTNSMSMLEQELKSMATLAGERVSYELDAYKNAISSLGYDAPVKRSASNYR